MIDIHCHLLFGLDDGARDLISSLAIARQLSQAGFTKVIATPHVFEERDFLDPDTIRKATRYLNWELQQEGIALEVLPGAENFIFPKLPQCLKEGKIMTLADSNRYVLLELPMQELPIYTEQVIFELQLQGIIPVLAHPERYHHFAASAEQLIEWKNKGVLMQIDLRSLEGYFGKGPQDAANWLLRSGLVQAVGTDTHHAALSDDRYKNTLQCFSQKVSPQCYKRYLESNPLAMIKGDELEMMDNNHKIIPFHSKRRGKERKNNMKQKIVSLFTNRNPKDFSLYH